MIGLSVVFFASEGYFLSLRVAYTKKIILIILKGVFDLYFGTNLRLGTLSMDQAEQQTYMFVVQLGIYTYIDLNVLYYLIPFPWETTSARFYLLILMIQQKVCIKLIEFSLLNNHLGKKD